MYREYSIVDDDTDDDAELIADVGYIASKIRILEQLHFRRYCETGQDDNEDTLVSRIEDSFCKGLGSISCNRNNKIIEQQSRSSVDSVAALTTQLNTVQRRRILANLLIQFYEDHERAKQQIFNSKDKNDIMSKSEAKQVVVDTTTSNNDTTTKSSSNTRFAENKSNHLKINENNDKVVTSRSEGNIGNFYHNKLGGGDVKVKAGGGDLKCCNSEISGSSISKTGLKRAFKLIRLENTVVQYTFNDSDLKGLVKELKKKVEYAEKMNWLCLSERQVGPPIRKYSIPKHQEVKKRFLEICDNIFSDEVKAALRLPAFDSYEWEDAEVIHLMQTMFTELGLLEKFNIPIITLREWLYEVYKHYNEVPFHNFRHCFCVAQMMYAITRQANLINRLGELEVLILLVSCICHDLDHPGYNNIYQINARTELALRYNDISPLENHHCSIAFRLLEHPDCNIFQNFNRETFNTIREGIIRCILATDMARHNEILTQFKEIIPIFDYSNRAHINLLCMVLIKVSDISNEARPLNVAEPWLDRLLQEFFAQSAAEKSQGLPVTPFMDPEKVSKPGSQVRFIGLVLLPLFEALGELLPELIDMIIIPVRVALDYYRRINDAQNKPRKSLAETAENSSDGGGGSGSPKLQRSQSGISVRSRRSIPSQKSVSRTSVDEATCVAAELHDLPEDSESGDSETATEVDVAEKASKFKVDTESGNRSKYSHSTSRKSSREKRPSMISEMCSSGGRIRNSFGNIHGYQPNRSHFSSNRAVSLDQYSCNNRRLSDGLQQVISDSNVFYNHHNRSLDSEGHSTFSVEKQKIMETDGGSKIIGEDVANNPPYEDSNSNKNILQQQINNKGIPNISHPNSVCYSSHNGSKSWKTRFRQITEYFSFGFEKTNKRFSSTKSSPCSLRKNNADILKQQQQQQPQQAQKQSTCCTLKYNISSRLMQRQEFSNVGRNRALSLDVPAKQRYSSSSGGDSRKSSRNEDNSIKHDLVNEDSNSNNTSNGDPPSARIRGGSDETDQTVFLPKVITPSLDVEHSSALDYTKSLSGRSRGEEVTEGMPRI